MDNTYRKALVISGIIFCLFSNVWAYSGGTGTEIDPYQIANATDLLELTADANDYNDCFILVNDIDLAGYTFTSAVIAPDINTSSGFQGTAFSGIFDGNGHVISNLTIDANENDYIGLFGKIVDADSVIKNLGIEDANIIGNGYIGSLVGNNEEGTVTSCYATGAVSGGFCVGGLVGAGGTITNCYATGAVNGDVDLIGGLIGDGGTLRYCYSTGAVSGVNRIGGLSGGTYSGSTISCFWDIETSGLTTSYGGTGLSTEEMKDMTTYSLNGWSGEDWTIDDGNDYPHLAWENAPGQPIAETNIPFQGEGTSEYPYEIENAEDLQFLSSKNFLWDKHFIMISNVNLQGIPLTPIGGSKMMGYVEFTGVFDGNDHIIRNVIMNDYDHGLFGYVAAGGKICNLGIENIEVTGHSGGSLAGENAGSIENCYCTGVVNNGWSSLGGLVGSNYGNVTNCHSTGSVSGIGGVGGLVGDNNGGTITKCYAAGVVIQNESLDPSCGGLVGWNCGIITDCYATTTVIGQTGSTSCVGGLVGYSGWGSIINCYSVGPVSNGYGLVGQNSDSVVASFWDIETSGQTTSAGGTGLTTAQMQDMDTYTSAGWDFVGETANGYENIWRMCVNGVYYPKLYWQFLPSDFVCPDGVSFEDLAYFVQWWLETDCSSLNNDCGRTDIKIDGTVNFFDFALFANDWLD